MFNYKVLDNNDIELSFEFTGEENDRYFDLVMAVIDFLHDSGFYRSCDSEFGIIPEYGGGCGISFYNSNNGLNYLLAFNDLDLLPWGYPIVLRAAELDDEDREFLNDTFKLNL